MERCRADHSRRDRQAGVVEVDRPALVGGKRPLTGPPDCPGVGFGEVARHGILVAALHVVDADARTVAPGSADRLVSKPLFVTGECPRSGEMKPAMEPAGASARSSRDCA